MQEKAGIQDRRVFASLVRQLAVLAGEEGRKAKFVEDVLTAIAQYFPYGCLEIILLRNDAWVHYSLARKPVGFSFTTSDEQYESQPDFESGREPISVTDILQQQLLKGRGEWDGPFFSTEGTFVCRDVHEFVDYMVTNFRYRVAAPEWGSIVAIPMVPRNEFVGILMAKDAGLGVFSEEDVSRLEELALLLSFLVVNRRMTLTLRERVKELTCLYQISKIFEDSELSLDDMLQRIVEVIPPAFQYPNITFAGINLDARVFHSSLKSGQSNFSITADLMAKGDRRGKVTVGYDRWISEFRTGVFLDEERSLLDTIAKQIGLIIERKELERNDQELRDQLRHADRLATIGQLSAGIAHELNEPLNAILGFAQLAKKSVTGENQLGLDLGEIVKASLHAREVIRKLLLFSRQMAPVNSRIDLNGLVEEGMFFLNSRLNKDNILLKYDFDANLPVIVGDRSQLTQVLVNLVVNAVQAMPQGGQLTLRTREADDGVSLSVEDTGIGIGEDVRKKIFLPFFTTKGVSEGTGLGLSVVHGIVASHGGAIEVDSVVGKGSRFTVRLPSEPPGELTK